MPCYTKAKKYRVVTEHMIQLNPIGGQHKLWSGSIDLSIATVEVVKTKVDCATLNSIIVYTMQNKLNVVSIPKSM